LICAPAKPSAHLPAAGNCAATMSNSMGMIFSCCLDQVCPCSSIIQLIYKMTLSKARINADAVKALGSHQRRVGAIYCGEFCYLAALCGTDIR
jgi:hypothetical protein